MKLINKNSERGFVNFLADYVLKKINSTGDYNTIIEVTNVGKFIIINGLTNCETLINLSDITSEIQNDYPDYKEYNSTNIIDVITYNVDLEETSELWVKCYNSTRPIYHPNLESIQLNEQQSISYHNEPITEIQPNTSTNFKFTHSPLNISSESLKVGMTKVVISTQTPDFFINLAVSKTGFNFPPQFSR